MKAPFVAVVGVLTTFWVAARWFMTGAERAVVGVAGGSVQTGGSVQLTVSPATLKDSGEETRADGVTGAEFAGTSATRSESVVGHAGCVLVVDGVATGVLTGGTTLVTGATTRGGFAAGAVAAGWRTPGDIWTAVAGRPLGVCGEPARLAVGPLTCGATAVGAGAG